MMYTFVKRMFRFNFILKKKKKEKPGFKELFFHRIE